VQAKQNHLFNRDMQDEQDKSKIAFRFILFIPVNFASRFQSTNMVYAFSNMETVI